MSSRFIRAEMLFGASAMEKLNNAKVAVFGLGGVGGYVAEALARSGIGALDLIDNDVVSVSNINRQILATEDTVGKLKTEVAEKRIKSINPDCKVKTFNTFFLPDKESEFDFTEYDYVVDAIDTVTGKKCIILCAEKARVPVISSLGTGNKTDPTRLKVSDIYSTSVCPLAKVMRGLCRKAGIKKLKVVFSDEPPKKAVNADIIKNAENLLSEENNKRRRDVPASSAFVPAVAGFIIAAEVVKDIIAK